jgi:branched-chain amino acid aminotransferase
MIGKYTIHNGKLIKAKDAKIGVDSIEFTYGFGVYENLKVRNRKVYFLVEHVERLFYSAGQIGLSHNFTPDQIEEWILELVKKNKTDVANVKMLLIGGKEPDLYIMTLAPKFLDKKFYKSGVKVITKEYERYLPQVKSLNMLPSYLIFREAKEKGAFDVLLIDKNNNIVEGTRSNFFVIKNKTLYTTPVESVLDGVTRRSVIDCAKKSGYEVIEQDIALEGVFNYDGAFLTNTSGKIVPIKTLNDGSFGEICDGLKELMVKYNEYLDALFLS